MKTKMVMAALGAMALIGVSGMAMAQRDPAYAAARAAGQVGEQPDGYLGIVGAATAELRALVNNAGLAVGKGPFDQGLDDDWARMLDTNVKGLLFLARACVPYMRAGSRMVNMGSIAGKQVYTGGNVYCASKHAVDALSQAMRIDLVDRGIGVSQICPGAAETEFSMVRFKGDAEAAEAVYLGYDPLVAQDIADAVQFVLSRPGHVCINDMVIMPTAQASAHHWNKQPS